jgi:hypothetical protein
MELTSTFVTLLQEFRCAFTRPSFVTFVALPTGSGASGGSRRGTGWGTTWPTGPGPARTLGKFGNLGTCALRDFFVYRSQGDFPSVGIRRRQDGSHSTFRFA